MKSVSVLCTVQSQVLSYRLERPTSPASAELCGIREALLYILRQPPAYWTFFCHSRIDRQSLPCASCFSFLEHAQREGKCLHHLAYVSGHRIPFQWLQDHSGIMENEKAHEAARRALHMKNRKNIFFTKLIHNHFQPPDQLLSLIRTCYCDPQHL